jgi:membrane associated rhomboid family serine protease
MQSKAESVEEAVVSNLAGCLVIWISQAVLFPLFGIYVSSSTSASIAGCIMVAMTAKSYAVRRWFEGRRP